MIDKIIIMTSETEETAIRAMDIAYMSLHDGHLVITFKNGSTRNMGRDIDIYLDGE